MLRTLSKYKHIPFSNQNVTNFYQDFLPIFEAEILIYTHNKYGILTIETYSRRKFPFFAVSEVINENSKQFFHIQTFRFSQSECCKNCLASVLRLRTLPGFRVLPGFAEAVCFKYFSFHFDVSCF